MPLTGPLRRLLPYYRPYRRQLVLGLLLVVASAGFVSVVPWVLRRAVDGIRAGAPLGRTVTLAIAMIALAVVGGAMRYWMRELMNGLSRWIEYDLRNDLFRQLETLDAAALAHFRTGDLMARMTNDLSAVRMAAGPAVMYLTNTVAGGAFALAFMVAIDPRLTVIALLPMVVMPAVGIWLGRRIHDRFEAVQEQFGRLTTMAQENVAGVRVVRAYRQEEAEITRFGALNDEYGRLNMRLARIQAAMSPAFQLFAGLGMAATLLFGGALIIRGGITVGAYVAFTMYLGMLTWPLIAIGWVTNLFQRGAASMGRLLDVLDARAAVVDPDTPLPLPPATSAGRSIEFRNVGFHYPAAPGEAVRWVLRDVSFTVPAGATLGLVGATGSGKSALMDLIPRLYDPQEGTILVDGVPIRRVALATLRREIGYVPQESFLFSEPIGANLSYGTEDPEAGRWAAGVAQLAESVEAFPDAYDTMLGERGINLSGGQKQRAALARALARRPAIVLLDDALSAVDTHTEAGILQGLTHALAGRTAIIASHRVSAVRDAARIIVLEEGRVVEQGRHADLFAANGVYWSLLSRQQLEESIEDEDEAVADAGTGR